MDRISFDLAIVSIVSTVHASRVAAGNPRRSSAHRLSTKGESTMTPEQEQEYRKEAERLAELPAAEQAAYLAWQGDIAGDAKLRKADRETAAARIKALRRELRRKKSRQNP